MEREIVLNYGQEDVNINGEKVTHKITSIGFDQFHKNFNFVIQRGEKVDYFVISMRFAQHLGIINFEPLKQFCK